MAVFKPEVEEIPQADHPVKFVRGKAFKELDKFLMSFAVFCMDLEMDIGKDEGLLHVHFRIVFGGMIRRKRVAHRDWWLHHPD